MQILRKDIKHIDIKLNYWTISKDAHSIHLFNGDYISIDSYLFKVSKIYKDKMLAKEKLLGIVTEML